MDQIFNTDRWNGKKDINKDELLYKISNSYKYSKEYNGYSRKFYNYLCSDENAELDSNIVEYTEDVLI